MKNSFNANNRSQSLNTLKYVRHQPLQTLAQKNLVSLKQPNYKYFINRPLRILLPDFFNIPKFLDRQFEFGRISQENTIVNNAISAYKQQKGLKKKLKDLSILAEGMKRAKNIRQESRYYFIQGVILHNSGSYQKSIEMFQKFLKIVLFIKDDKSIQLALNSIAIGYMYLNRYEQAIQYHLKQHSLNLHTQNFVGKVNIGLCFELMKNKNSAYQIYAEILQTIENENLRKIQFMNRLIQRSRPEQGPNYFLTQNHQNKSILKSPPKYRDISPKGQQRYMYKKILKQKSPNKNYNLQFENSFMKRQYQNQKVNFAIFNAQQNLNGYLKDLKSSFTIDH